MSDVPLIERAEGFTWSCKTTLISFSAVDNTVSTTTLVIDSQNLLGECVLWCERTERVFWTDILGSMLWSRSHAEQTTRRWTMPNRVCNFAFTTHNDWLLVGFAKGFSYFNLSTEELVPVCAVEPDLLTTRINDGRCDRQGRFVFGTMNEDPARATIAGFYRLDTQHRLEKLPLPATAIANSICFNPDGNRMYYCDSLTKTIRRCDYDPESGAISNDRVLVDLRSEAGEPDGSTVDSEGYLWNARWGGARIVRYAPSGKVDRIVEVPVPRPTCVAFGGAKLDHLFITSARDGLSRVELEKFPDSGALFCVENTGATGLPECRFGGATPALASRKNGIDT